MMALVADIPYDAASPEVRAVYDDIMATRGIDWVPNFWRAIAVNPALLRETWEGLKTTMAPGRLDPLTKELLAIAVSATNGCEYCLNSHTAAARKLGLDDAMLGELMAVVGAFNRTNKMVEGLQVEVDPPLRKAARGES